MKAGASVVYAGERIVQGLIRGLVRARLALPRRTGRVS